MVDVSKTYRESPPFVGEEVQELDAATIVFMRDLEARSPTLRAVARRMTRTLVDAFDQIAQEQV